MNITEARANAARLKSELADAEKLVAELEMEPLRLWVNVAKNGVTYSHKTKESAEANAIMLKGYDRIAVPMVEVRPVRITDTAVYEARRIWDFDKRIRDVMEYALSLAGVEVEK